MLRNFTIQLEDNDPVTISLTGRAKRLWILIAYLIINKSRGVSAEELIGILWTETDEKHSLSKLQNNVSRARNAL